MSETRYIQPEELPKVAKLLNDTFRSRVTDQDVVTDFPLFFTPGNVSNCRIVVVDGEIVSHAGIFPCELVVDGRCFKTGVIILVATAPAHRHQGYAAQLMLELQRIMRDDDYDLGLLWTGVPTFYEKLGWEVVTPRGWMIDDLREVQERISAVQYVEGSAVAYDEEKHLDGIIDLHDREPVRTARSREEYRALLSLPKIQVFVLERNQHVAAYLVAADAVNKRGFIEYGGSAPDILSVASYSLETAELNGQLPLLIYHTYEDVAQTLSSFGVPMEPLECSKGRGCEMIFNVNADRLPQEVRDRIFNWGLDFT